MYLDVVGKKRTLARRALSNALSLLFRMRWKNSQEFLKCSVLYMLTSGSVRVLSRRLFGGCCVWNEAVQLLSMSCINQPFIELVLHKDLELLPLFPEVVIESKSIWEGKPQQIYSRNTTERLFLVTPQFSLFGAQWQTTSQGLFAVTVLLKTEWMRQCSDWWE